MDKATRGVGKDELRAIAQRVRSGMTTGVWWKTGESEDGYTVVVFSTDFRVTTLGSSLEVPTTGTSIKVFDEDNKAGLVMEIQTPHGSAVLRCSTSKECPLELRVP